MIFPTHPRRSVALLSGLLFGLGLTSSSAQQAARPAGDLVEVDFMAVTADGRPVANLTAEQVMLRVDGRVRPIRSLRFVQAETPSADKSGAARPALPAPFATNARSDDARTFAVVIDDETILPGREKGTTGPIEQFLASLGPRDRVAIVTVPHGGIVADFTNDRERLTRALSQIAGKARATETPSEASCRTRDTVQALAGLLNSLGGGEGPTNVLLLSSSLSGPTGIVQITSGQAIGMCQLLPEEFTKVGEAAASARAHFYILQSEDYSLKSQAAMAGLENLAGVTGGTRLYLGATGPATMDRIARETSAYYLAGFEPDSGDRNGATHQMSVRVQGDNIVVHARPDLRIPRAGDRPSRASAPSTPQDMLKQAKGFPDLPLRVTTYLSRNQGDEKVRILAAVEPASAGTKLAALSVGLFDAKGVLKAQWTASPGNLAGTPVMAALIAPAPGTYRLRAAAIDADKRGGAVDEEVHAELISAGSLKLSSLVLGVSRNGGFAPQLQFANEPAVVGYVELIGGKSGAGLTAADLELATSLNGPALVTVRLTPAATNEPDRFTATATLAIGDLTPGDYVVRAIVGLQGEPEGRVVRTLRKISR